METPPTIKEEDGRRWTVENARPLFMRMAIGVVTPIVLAAVGWTMWNDALEHRWVMLAIRAAFALLVLASARFSLFGSESLAVEGGQLVYRRGRHEERCAVGDVERLERQGNLLRVHVRGPAGEARPIIVGAGLRQQPAAMKWLAERLQSAIQRARSL
ncbi:MAG TPA: hypothetical protein VF997_15870 [Polyangia bacterium]